MVDASQLFGSLRSAAQFSANETLLPADLVQRGTEFAGSAIGGAEEDSAPNWSSTQLDIRTPGRYSFLCDDTPMPPPTTMVPLL